MNIELLLGGAAVVASIVAYHVRMYTMVKRLLAMHENPDDYDFGTEDTNRLVVENRQMFLQSSEKQTRYLRELLHYTKAMCRLANNGKEVLPPEPRELEN